MDLIPNEILNHLLSFVPKIRQIKNMIVCKRWYESINIIKGICKTFEDFIIGDMVHYFPIFINLDTLFVKNDYADFDDINYYCQVAKCESIHSILIFRANKYENYKSRINKYVPMNNLINLNFTNLHFYPKIHLLMIERKDCINNNIFIKCLRERIMANDIIFIRALYENLKKINNNLSINYILKNIDLIIKHKRLHFLKIVYTNYNSEPEDQNLILKKIEEHLIETKALDYTAELGIREYLEIIDFIKK